MSLEKIRDIIFIVCAVVFVIVYSISNLIPILFPSWYYNLYNQSTTGIDSFSQDGYNPPQIYADCQSNNNSNTLTIQIANYAESDVENIRCNLVDKAGLISSEDSQVISSLSSGSTDICSFSLEGKYEKPLRVEVTYNEKSIRQAVQCYPLFS